jgi:hypothetical protein
MTQLMTLRFSLARGLSQNPLMFIFGLGSRIFELRPSLARANLGDWKLD